jgi:hypothetical protein
VLTASRAKSDGIYPEHQHNKNKQKHKMVVLTNWTINEKDETVE